MALNLVLLLVLAAVSLASLALGSLSIPLPEVIRALRGEGSPVTALVVTELGLPRLLAGWVTGAAFALAGVVMQTLARNRLATPGIIGIDNAATAFAVASVVGTGVIGSGWAAVFLAKGFAVTAFVRSDTRGARSVLRSRWVTAPAAGRDGSQS